MYHYLALGDSYTCGEAVEPAFNFPHQLADGLRGQGVDIADPTVVAVTGWTTAELAAGIEQASLHPPYDLVTLLIGVNNQYRGEVKGYTKSQYQTEFEELLKQTIQFAGDKPARVIVLSIPDWGAMPAGEGADRAVISADIDAYNAINRRAATIAGVHYLDITPLSRRALQDTTLVASDGLHPSAAMYAQWIALLQPLALSVLQG